MGDSNEKDRDLIEQEYIIQELGEKFLNDIREAFSVPRSTLEAIDMIEQLAPYVRAEYQENPEKYDNGKTVAECGIIGAAARRARADGKHIPLLLGEKFGAEQLEMPLEEISSEHEASNAFPVDLIPILKAVMPKSHTSPNTRLSNEIQKGGIINAGDTQFTVANKGKKNELNAFVTISYLPEDGVKLPSNKIFSEYDRQVYDAICSIWLYGDQRHLVTPAIVYRAMTGTDLDPSASQKAAITKSIEKARRLFADIDATAEVKAYQKTKGIEPDEDATYLWNDAILSAVNIKVRNGKEIQDAYSIKNEPLLLGYARATNKCLSSKTDLLDIKEIDSNGNITQTSIANSEGRIAIKGYLWRRIMLIKRDNEKAKEQLRRAKSKGENEKTLDSFRKQSDTILFKTLFEETDQDSPNRQTQLRNREYAFQVLDFFKAMGQIRGYKKQTGERGSITGVSILL